MDEAQREAHDALDDSLLDGVDSPGADTMSDDGTIDGNDPLMDPILNPHRHGLSFASTPRTRPRPRSLHELPSYHVEMPLLPFDQVQHIGPWTPGAPFTPEARAALASPHLNLMNSSGLYHHDGYDRRSRSPGMPAGFDAAGDYPERARSSSRTPSRRHTMESTSSLFGATSMPIQGYGESSVRPLELGHYSHYPRAGYFGVDEMGRYTAWANTTLFASEPPRRPMPGAVFRNPGDGRQSFLRPEPGFSAFEANHEAIMSTIPGSRSGSRHASRSNSPHVSRVNSRSGLSNLLAPPRSYSSTPLSQGETGGRGSRAGHSRERSRLREEAHREAMLQALAEADAAQQLRPDFPLDDSEGQIELPLLPPDLMERVMSPATSTGSTAASPFPAEQPIPGQDADHDVTMTQ